MTIPTLACSPNDCSNPSRDQSPIRLLTSISRKVRRMIICSRRWFPTRAILSLSRHIRNFRCDRLRAGGRNIFDCVARASRPAACLCRCDRRQSARKVAVRQFSVVTPPTTSRAFEGEAELLIVSRAQYLVEGQAAALLRQIGVLFADEEEFCESGMFPSMASLAAFLDFLIAARPSRLPSVAINSEGEYIASWSP